MKKEFSKLLFFGMINALFLSHAAAWTDDPLVPGTTPIRTLHVTELRGAIAAKRADYGFIPVTWTDPALTAGVSQIRLAHLTEMRTALNAILNKYKTICPSTVPAHAFTDPSLTAGVTLIRAVHFTELRAVSDSIGTCLACCGSCSSCEGGSGCAFVTSGQNPRGDCPGSGPDAMCKTAACDGAGACLNGPDVPAPGCNATSNCGDLLCCIDQECVSGVCTSGIHINDTEQCNNSPARFCNPANGLCE